MSGQRQERINALPGRQPPEKTATTGRGQEVETASLRRAAESLWPAGSADDRINDRPPGTFNWVEDAREPGGRMVRPVNGPPHNGAVFVARSRSWPMDERSTWKPAVG